MSNSTAERICEKRKQDNLPALAVQWGAVGDVGMAMTLLGDKTDINIGTVLTHHHFEQFTHTRYYVCLFFIQMKR